MCVGYEVDIYDVVLSVQKEYPQIRIYLVISQMADLHEMRVINERNIVKRRGFDDFILLLAIQCIASGACSQLIAVRRCR